MMRACSKGRHEILAYLIKCGADPLLKDVGGQIALMLSAGAGESKCVEQALTLEGLNETVCGWSSGDCRAALSNRGEGA